MKNDVWEYLKYKKLPIIIYGMGNGADKLIFELHKNNIHISEIIASDSFVRGQTYQGYKVKTLDMIKNKYDDFLILIAFATQLDNVLNHIYDLSENHRVIAPSVPVYGNTLFNYEYYKENYNSIQYARSLMSDSKSLEVFDNFINYMLYGKLDYIRESQTNKSEALTEILKLNNNECYADLGAYKGDTIDELIDTCNGYNSIYAFEPDKKTYYKLVEHTKHLPKILTYNKGIWSDNTQLPFDFNSGRNSTLSDTSNSVVDVVSLDNVLKNKKITYIKMDIEGAEYEGIIGAKNILATQKPKLNIALYHRSEDIFKLPLLINKINKNYKMYLRHHPYIPFWDTNLYCV